MVRLIGFIPTLTLKPILMNENVQEPRTKYAILLVPLSMLMLGLLRCGQFISEHSSMVLNWAPFNFFNSGPLSLDSYSCVHSYTIELLSIDPLVIYINDFLSNDEIEHLLDIGKVTSLRQDCPYCSVN